MCDLITTTKYWFTIAITQINIYKSDNTFTPKGHLYANVYSFCRSVKAIKLYYFQIILNCITF